MSVLYFGKFCSCCLLPSLSLVFVNANWFIKLIIVAGQDMLQNQVKKLLNEMVESTLDFVSMFPRMKNRMDNDCGVRLFKRCSTGIIFDNVG